MKMLKYWTAISTLAVCGIAFTQGSVGEYDAGRNVVSKDFGGTVTLSGNVKGEYAMISKKVDGVQFFGTAGLITDGTNTGTPQESANQYDVEAEFRMDYKNENTWGAIKLRTNQNMGSNATQGYVTKDDTVQSYSLKLSQAYMGLNLYEEGASNLSMEFGRQQLGDLYDSKIQFDNRTKHDGLVLKYANSLESLGDAHVTLSKFIYNDRTSAYPWAIELGLANVMDSGLFVKYSYIDWQKKVASVAVQGTKSQNSQILAGYNFNPEMLKVPFKVYAAYLINHAAKKGDSVNNGRTVAVLTVEDGVATNTTWDDADVATTNKRENNAWYIGAQFGEAEKEGQFEVDINYQDVKQNSILRKDVAGVGRHNMVGPNYKGFSIKGAFAVTDNLRAHASYLTAEQKSKEYRGYDGGMERKFKRLELELSYAF